jgi:hypothetical protein
MTDRNVIESWCIVWITQNHMIYIHLYITLYRSGLEAKQTLKDLKFSLN